MADGFRVDVETAGLLRAMAAMPAAVQARLMEACRETALAIQTSARARLSGMTHGTGETARGIVAEPSYDGKGYVVRTSDMVSGAERARRVELANRFDLSGRNRRFTRSIYESVPHIGLWVEAGTVRGEPRSHTAPARPFLWPAANAENGPYERRVRDAIRDATEDVGLGD